MSFSGWLIKFSKTNTLFPHRLIQKDTYKSTPLQRTEVKAYRDNNNLLHRVTSPNFKSKIEFQTYPLSLSELIELRNCLRAAYSNYQQRKLDVEYWDEELMAYRTMTAYVPDITYDVKTISANNIKYGPVKLTFIEY